MGCSNSKPEVPSTKSTSTLLASTKGRRVWRNPLNPPVPLPPRLNSSASVSPQEAANAVRVFGVNGENSIVSENSSVDTRHRPASAPPSEIGSHRTTVSAVPRSISIFTENPLSERDVPDAPIVVESENGWSWDDVEFEVLLHNHVASQSRRDVAGATPRSSECSKDYNTRSSCHLFIAAGDQSVIERSLAAPRSHSSSIFSQSLRSMSSHTCKASKVIRRGSQLDPEDSLILLERGRYSPGFFAAEPENPRWWESYILNAVERP